MMAHIRRLYDHMVWADARTLNALRAMHAAPLDALRLYGHLLAAEHVWLSRIEEREPEYPPGPHSTSTSARSSARRTTPASHSWLRHFRRMNSNDGFAIATRRATNS